MIGVLAPLALALVASAPPTSPPGTTLPVTSGPPPASTATTTPAASATTSPPKPIPEGFVALVDDLGAIVVAVPEAWTDIDTVPAVVDGMARPYIAAAPDLATFHSTFEVPGMEYVALPFAADPLVAIDAYGLRGGCETIEVRTYDDPVFTGIVQVGTNCGPQQMTWNMVVANPADESFTAVVKVQAVPDDDAIEIVRRTFNVVGDAGTIPGSSVPGSSLPGASVPTSSAPSSSAPG